MTSSTFKDKSYIKEKYKDLEVVSTNMNSFNKPSWVIIDRDIEVFDNGNIIVRKKKWWWELEEII